MSSSSRIEGFSRDLAFIVGIDRYTNGVPELRTPVADATSLAGVLRDKHGFKTKVVVNDKATIVRLRRSLKALSRYVGPDDRVLFYFAGHGIAVENDGGPVGYILPQDADSNSTDRYLPMVELDKALSNLQCRHILVVLDCCFAGAFRWSNSRNLALRPENLHQERYSWYVQGSAWQAIASAAHDQKALDVAAGWDLGDRGRAGDHSPFAKALMDGLEGAADLPRANSTGDGVITATELFLFVEQQLMPAPGSNRSSQNPVLWPLPKHDKGQYVFLVPGRPLELPPAPPLDPTTNPWRGAEPYKESDARLFFGRKRISEQLLARVLQDQLVVVTGPSGIGKSSLVRAGLLPRLPGSIRSIVVRPGQAPFANLAAALRDSTPANLAAPDQRLLETDPNALKVWANKLADAGHEILLVIDSADELVSQEIDPEAPTSILSLIKNAIDQSKQRPPASAHSKAEAESALRSLGYDNIRELSEDDVGVWHVTATKEGELVPASFGFPRLPLRVVLTVRSDCDQKLALSPLAEDGMAARFIVPQMTQDELRRVIEGPATEAVMRFESEDLVDILVNNVVQMPGALAILSRVLSEIYKLFLSQPATDRSLTRAHYEALQGGIGGFVCGRAEEVIEDLDTAHRLTARCVLERMVEPESLATRRVPLRELYTADAGENERVDDVLRRLDTARLIIFDNAEVGGSLELAHNALILHWDRLQNWVREDSERIAALRRLTPDAREWATSNKTELLWADAVRSGPIQTLLSIKHPGLNAVEESFAHASLARAERIRRRQRQAIVILAVAAAIFAAVAVAALWFQHLANQNAALANAQSARNRSLLLTSQSRDVLGTNDQRALLLAVEAAKSTSEQGYVVPAALSALHDALRRVSGVGINGHQDQITIAAFSGDEHFLATGAEDPSTAQLNEVRVWDLSNPLAPSLAQIAQGRNRLMHISFDRKAAHLLTVQTASWDEPRTDALVWTLVDGERYPVSRPLVASSYQVGVIGRSNNGLFLAATTSVGTVQLISLEDLSTTIVLRTLRPPTDSRILRFAFAPDDSVLLGCTATSNVWIWDLSSSSAEPVASIDARHRADRPVSPDVGVDICGVDASHSMIFTASSDWLDNSTWADLNLKLWSPAFLETSPCRRQYRGGSFDRVQGECVCQFDCRQQGRRHDGVRPRA
ncbi:caspase family protein [Mesorhizobium sp. M1060]|uniref:nSTAND1 domain-containing NTPase n=1 Tax=Mesorhizobium sp. M1060 TaxID=2957052 RepID=UPI00333BFD33